MEITVFAKKRQTKDGAKTFFSYLGKLTRKDGTQLTVSLKFRDECGAPASTECPMNIIVEKQDANLSDRIIGSDRETGEAIYGHTLWVSKWKRGSDYVDHSLDDFE